MVLATEYSDNKKKTKKIENENIYEFY